MSATPANGKQVAVHGVLSADDIDQVITVLREHVLALSEPPSRAPGAVRVSARGVEVELSWPDSAQFTHAGKPTASAPNASARTGPVPASETAGTGTGKAGSGEASTFPLCASVVGVFYRAPEPGANPFVSEGETVQAGQQVAIIEAMKLMIPVEAERPGTITEILVTDGEPVEHGQPLMTLAPAESEGNPR